MPPWLLTLGEVDERLLRVLVLRRRTLAIRAMRAVTRLGDPLSAVVLALLLLVAPSPGSPLVPLEAALTLATSHLLVQVIKRLANRPRPRLPLGTRSLTDAPDRFSFPSGHAAAALSLALPLVPTLSLALALPLLGLALLVGVSRCYLGVHYPGDVLVGWVLAGICAVGGHALLPWIL